MRRIVRRGGETSGKPAGDRSGATASGRYGAGERPANMPRAERTNVDPYRAFLEGWRQRELEEIGQRAARTVLDETRQNPPWPPRGERGTTIYDIAYPEDYQTYRTPPPSLSAAGDGYWGPRGIPMGFGRFSTDDERYRQYLPLLVWR